MALNGWRMMWIFAVFDLPTQTKEQRHDYTNFRQLLLKNGFTQLQYSVYIRNMPTFRKASALVEQLGKETPAEGVCAFLFFTDKQYALTRNFIGGREKNDELPEDEQLLLFD